MSISIPTNDGALTNQIAHTAFRMLSPVIQLNALKIIFDSVVVCGNGDEYGALLPRVILEAYREIVEAEKKEKGPSASHYEVQNEGAELMLEWAGKRLATFPLRGETYGAVKIPAPKSLAALLEVMLWQWGPTEAPNGRAVTALTMVTEFANRVRKEQVQEATREIVLRAFSTRTRVQFGSQGVQHVEFWMRQLINMKCDHLLPILAAARLTCGGHELAAEDARYWERRVEAPAPK